MPAVQLPLSPWNYFQERYSGEPWRLLCCVVMLNQTSGRQLEGIDKELFGRWPTAVDLTMAEIGEVEGVVRPLGLWRRRARTLVRLSTHWAFMWDGDDPGDLPGCGKYATDSYALFVRGEVDIDPQDKELRRYLSWLKGTRG